MLYSNKPTGDGYLDFLHGFGLEDNPYNKALYPTSSTTWIEEWEDAYNQHYDALIMCGLLEVYTSLTISQSL